MLYRAPLWRPSNASNYSVSGTKCSVPSWNPAAHIGAEQLQGQVDFASNQSAFAVARNILREEGFLSFWRGNLPNVMRVSGTAAINFTCMDYYRNVAVAPFFEESIVQRQSTSNEEIQRRRRLVTAFVSGGLAGATSTTVLYPFEFLRTRLAMDVGAGEKRVYSGMRSVVRDILASDGVFGFYQGYGIALAGGIFYRILFLGGYEGIKQEALSYKERKQRGTAPVKLTWAERFACAQTISVTAGTLSYPLDSVRRRMMMQAGTDPALRQYRNSIHCLVTVAQKEGIRGFYLGLGPNIVRSIGGALLLVGYDSFRWLLK